MKVFNFAWTWYEDYQPHILMHETKDESEFNADCHEALRAVGTTYLASEQSWASMPDWIDAAVKHMEGTMGYVAPPIHKFSIFGGYVIKDSDTDDCKTVLGDDLFNAAVKHNEEIEKQ